MRESVVRYGPDESLVGIVTEPERVDEGAPAAIVLNAAMLHRVGPFRMSVDLTRRLAMRGIPALRFDLAGIGDSVARGGDNRPERERVRADVAAGMEVLARRFGTERFVPIGLCSGAYNAHNVAASDPRVAGAVFLDGYGYRTRGYHLRRLGPLLFWPRRWRNAARRQLARLTGARPTGPGRPRDPRMDIFDAPFPAREQTRAELEGMVARGARLLFVFTGGVPEYFNGQNQLREMYGTLADSPLVASEYYPESDHTYPALAHRRVLFERIEAWFARHFLGTASPIR